MRDIRMFGGQQTPDPKASRQQPHPGADVSSRSRACSLGGSTNR